MAKNSHPEFLQALKRHTLDLLRELEKEKLDLAVQGECHLAVAGLEAASRQLLQALFDYVEWRDPG